MAAKRLYSMDLSGTVPSSLPSARLPSLRNADRAANQPHIPWTPPPGAVDAKQRKSRGFGVA